MVVPSKNRYRTLFPLVDALMKWESRDFELVVQDNSTNNSEAIEHFKPYANDERLKYFYVSEFLNANQNCDLAISRATGEYVCFIGDDDGVVPRIVDFCQLMYNNQIDSAHCTPAYYNWPDLVIQFYGKAMSGKMTILNPSGKIDILNTEKELDKLLAEGGLVITRLPRVYHGVVRKSCLDALKAQTGTYFPGPVPDMAGAVAMTYFVKKHVNVDFPIVISGASGHSMAGRGAVKRHISRIEDEKTLPSDAAANWSKLLPRYWAPQTIWPEAAIKALEKLGKEEKISQLNLGKIYAACLMYVPDFRGMTLNTWWGLCLKQPSLFFSTMWYFSGIIFSRIHTLWVMGTRSLGINNIGTKDTIVQSEHIGEAIDSLNDYLKTRNFSL